MKFEYETIETCGKATGLVVVVDVIRAFTAAAFAFAGGADSIILVSTVDEAMALHDSVVRLNSHGRGEWSSTARI